VRISTTLEAGMRPHNVVGRSSPPYRVLLPVRPTGAGLHRAERFPAIEPAAGARLVLSVGVLIAVPLLALNLRPAVTSVGAMLTDIESGTGMSTVLASAVVAAPVWCFAVGGALAWAMRARLGTARTVSFALAALAATLASRVLGGPYLLLGGTIVACLAIAVLGTLLPVITHAAPARAWALLTGCYVAAMGGGSGIGALITPQVAGHSSWQLGVSGWALLAAAAWAAWRVASRRFTESPTGARKNPGPASLAPAATAWSLTLHFGLTSGFTFSMMGWLPSILLDYAHVPPGRAEWMFTIAMALGVPVALLVPKWARATPGQSGLAVALAAPSLVATVGLLMFPAWNPWLWSIGLGLGMPAVGLALAMISMRAAADTDTAAALSSMVQGIGYAIAGASALACGLIHSSTQTWDWPLLALLVILCGQIMAGMHAGLPVTVHAGGRAERRRLAAASRPALAPALPPAQPSPPVQTDPYPQSPPVGIPLPRNGNDPLPNDPAPRPVPTSEMAASVNRMAPAGRFSVAMNAVPQYLLGTASRRPAPPGAGNPFVPATGRAPVHGGSNPFVPTTGRLPVHGPDRPPVHGPSRPPAHGPNRPPVHGPSRPPAHGPNRPPVHGPNRPPAHGPARPPVHGPFPPPDREGTWAAVADDTVTDSLAPRPRETPETTAPAARPGENGHGAADAQLPVQLELDLLMGPEPEAAPEARPAAGAEAEVERMRASELRPRTAVDRDVFAERTIHIPYPRKPSW
jgi:CP family cyanate transporter-like MFS transporter